MKEKENATKAGESPKFTSNGALVLALTKKDSFFSENKRGSSTISTAEIHLQETVLWNKKGEF